MCAIFTVRRRCMNQNCKQRTRILKIKAFCGSKLYEGILWIKRMREFYVRVLWADFGSKKFRLTGKSCVWSRWGSLKDIELRMESSVFLPGRRLCSCELRWRRAKSGEPWARHGSGAKHVHRLVLVSAGTLGDGDRVFWVSSGGDSASSIPVRKCIYKQRIRESIRRRSERGLR